MVVELLWEGAGGPAAAGLARVGVEEVGAKGEGRNEVLSNSNGCSLCCRGHSPGLLSHVLGKGGGVDVTCCPGTAQHLAGEGVAKAVCDDGAAYLASRVPKGNPALKEPDAGILALYFLKGILLSAACTYDPADDLKGSGPALLF